MVTVRVSPYLVETCPSDFTCHACITSSLQDGTRAAGADEKIRAELGDFAEVGPVAEVGPGVMRYVDRDGNKVVVSARDNPDLYAAAKDAYNSLTGLSKSESAGHRRAGDNEFWPPAFGTTLDPLHDSGPGSPLHGRHGEQAVGARCDNTALCEPRTGTQRLASA
ncbi:hypothetical protein EWW49_29280, partial [Pseudomonas syringae]